MRWRVLSTGSLMAALAFGCDKPQPPALQSPAPQSVAVVESVAAPVDTLHFADTATALTPVAAHEKTIMPGLKSRILDAARNNTKFKADAWLRSDREFMMRGNPRRISQYDPIIKKMARRYGFDWRLIAAQIYAESNFNDSALSHCGAHGLMQVMPSTARAMGINPDQLLRPDINIAVGCYYNQKLFSLWRRNVKDAEERLAFTLASYNAGRRRVLNSFAPAQPNACWETVHPELPEETQTYVHKIYLKHDLYKKQVLP